jgi:YbbR domain-containing protein
MKKKPFNSIVTVIALVLVGAMFVYFYVSLNRLDNKLKTVSTTIQTNSSKITSIVNFINSSQTNATATK